MERTRERLIGWALLAGGLLGALAYGWLVFVTEWATLVLKITAFLAVAALMGLIAWIGFTLATSPPIRRLPKVVSALDDLVNDDPRRP